jgi:RNA polymerase sigma-70 factor (ECF subfamily)
MTDEQQLAPAFEAQRGYLRTVAQRMLGDRSEAEDAVQEAWLRLSRADASAIDNLEAWLTTVTARICLDMLRARGARPEQPMEVVLPNTALDPDAADPADEALLAERVGLALYVVLDALRPAERLAFVMHDLFGVPLDSIATTLGRTPNATKQLAMRARARVRAAEPGEVRDDEHPADHAVVESFFAAARDGDFDALVALLDSDVQLRAEGPSTVDFVRGAAEVAGRALIFRRAGARLHPARIGDDAGVVITVDGRPVSMMAFSVTGGSVHAIRAVTDPDRLARLVPSWVG